MMKTEFVDYHAGDTIFSGALVWDDGVSEARPAVLMAPDWMGISDGALEMARQIAGARFVVFLADLYGKNIRPSTMEEAAALANPLKADIEAQRVRTSAALAAMQREAKSRGVALEGPCGAIGFCFGGTNVLELARMGAEVQVVICVHGELMTTIPVREGLLKSRIVILHGSRDPVAPKEHRDALEAELTAAKAEWWEAVFGGAVHSFTDPMARIENVAHFDPKAAKWARRIIDQTLADELPG